MKKVIALLLAFVLVISGCSQQPDNAIYESAEGTFNTQVDEKQILLERTPANNETVTLINDELVKFLDGHVFGKGLAVAEARREDLASSKPVTLTWRTEKENTGYTVIYTTKQDFSDAVKVDTTEPQLILEDLFVATTYYWQVVTHTANGDSYSTVFCFKTAETPRWITVEGVYNSRDLGGYLTEDGKYRIKQGMIFRGSRLDSITEKGTKKFLEFYKVKTDFDLRDSSDSGFTGEGPLGDKVNYINIGGVGYASSIGSRVDAFREELLVFMDESNYPIYGHCSAGRDRCGTLMFHIGALLGMSKAQLLADYEMTYMSSKSYAKGDTKGHDWMYAFLSGFELLEGETYSEKAVNFWLAHGITQEQIDTLRSIMLEEVK